MKSRILVVDDEAELRGIYAEILGLEGYDVSVAGSGQAALMLLEHSQPDLVITDYMMPGMNGIELMQMLRKRMPDLPVIIISGLGDIRVAVQSLKEDAFDYLEKPVEQERLLEVCAQAIARQQAVRAAPSTEYLGQISYARVGAGGAVSEFSIHGALDQYGRQRMLQGFQTLIGKNAPARKVVVNLKNVKYINNVGLNTLLEMDQVLRSRQCIVIYTQIQDPVYQYLKTLGYTNYLRVIQNADEAVAHAQTAGGR